MKRSALAAIVFLFLLAAMPARPQGCAQCRDNAAGAPPKTQAAYRHAITLMIISAGSLFIASVFLLRKER